MRKEFKHFIPKKNQLNTKKYSNAGNKGQKSCKVYRKQSKMTEIGSFFINILNVNGLNAD